MISKPAAEWKETASKIAHGIRKRVLEHTILNKGGYLSQACSSAEIFAALYTKVLNLGDVEKPLLPKPFSGVPGGGSDSYTTGSYFNGPKSPTFDRFILSPSQYSLVLYAALIEVGRMDQDGLSQFNQDGSSVEMIGAEHSPGMEVMSGSLGQGISQAAGIALARKLKNESGRVVVFMSDGECQSGQFWEALQSMSFLKLDNMLIYIDINWYQCDGKMDSVMNIEPFDKRLEAFGARVYRVDGHNLEALAGLGNMKPDGRPVFVLADTDPARDIDILRSRAPKYHYVRFSGEEDLKQYRLALVQLR